MAAQLTIQERTREELIKELKVLRAQLAVFEEEKAIRIKAEEEYRKMHERFTGIYNSSKDAIGYATLSGTLIDVNESFSKLTGYTKEELLGRKYQDLTPCEYYEYEAKIIERILQTGKPEEYEKEYIRKDGTRVPILLTVFIVRGEDKEPISLAAIIKDITEQKKIEGANKKLETELARRAEDLESQLASLVEYSADGIIATTLEGKIVSWNPSAERIYGYLVSEAIGKHISIVMPPEHQDIITEIVEKLKSGQRTVQYEAKRIRKDGKEIYVSADLAPIKDSKGDITAICAIIRDITEKKLSEELHLLLASIIESSSDAIFSIASDGTILSWNHAAEYIYGYSTKDIKGKHCSILVPQEKEEELPMISKIIKEGEYLENYETVRMKKDGTRINISLTVFPIKDASGKITGTSVIVRDITKSKQLQQEFEKIKLVQEHQKEISDLEDLANKPNGDILTQLYGFVPLSQSFPLLFMEIVEKYEDLLELEIQNKSEKNNKKYSDEINFIAKQLGILKASPKDVLEVHANVLKKRSRELSSEKAKDYTEISRKMVIELMGHLVSYYRSLSITTKQAAWFDSGKQKSFH
ncbi:MAG: PAS domain S-box protein [Candidatus Melainabacteria bacterium]|nr:PAS domain S-box protein [Candidatus Melainabacteria bacterium]